MALLVNTNITPDPTPAGSLFVVDAKFDPVSNIINPQFGDGVSTPSLADWAVINGSPVAVAYLGTTIVYGSTNVGSDPAIQQTILVSDYVGEATNLKFRAGAVNPEIDTVRITMQYRDSGEAQLELYDTGNVAIVGDVLTQFSYSTTPPVGSVDAVITVYFVVVGTEPTNSDGYLTDLYFGIGFFGDTAEYQIEQNTTVVSTSNPPYDFTEGVDASFGDIFEIFHRPTGSSDAWSSLGDATLISSTPVVPGTGYGQTAPYGELDYKGEIYPDTESYSELAVGLLIEQYKKPYINSATSTTVIVSEPVVIPGDYPEAAEALVIEQYRKDYING